MKTILITPHHVLRREAEICISDVYEREYGAHVDAFPTTLIAGIDRLGVPICAAGLRFADGGFFSESYLDHPIEQVLSDRTGRRIDRKRVFEVTTLACRSAGAALPFVREIVEFGEAQGFACAFFTATERLRALLCHTGLPLMVLGQAEPTRITRPERWGDYYSQTPRVCAVDGRRLASRRVLARIKYAHA